MFVKRLDACEEAALYDTARRAGEFLDRLGHPWWTSHGTLLGAWRHRGIIPWDDDLDLAFPRDHVAELEAAANARGWRFARLGPFLAKVWDPRAALHRPKHPWTWPFFDIALYDVWRDRIIVEFGNHAQFHSFAKNDVLPTRTHPFGPLTLPGRGGPTNGMYALQKELRKRIAGGLDWLSIKSMPASDGAMPWFWHWDDRRYAVWWDSEGRPFAQGPNMLFTSSWKPRIDAEERGLLDAANCRAMFCHSDWYRDLIARNRGPANTSPIVTWPYPIDPWPGEPLPDEYDILIYSKNGNRPGLLEHLCEVFPRHVVLHYGQYKWEQLFEAARRSRACAYLADDDHGPLALQEILLAGCPVVGVRTGAPFIQNGVTGIIVDRLPPGAKCVKNDADEVALGTFVEAIQATQQTDRHSVRAAASEVFGTAHIAGQDIEALATARSRGQPLVG